MEDKVKPIGKPTAWGVATPTKPEAVEPVEEKPQKVAAAPDTLADKMQNKLTSVNIPLSGLPRAEVAVDEAEGAEVTVYVEKGFASEGRLHQLMRCVRDALRDCAAETDSEERSEPGMRSATIRFRVIKLI